MNSRFKFPRRVRIHGGECGAVARALHHEAKIESLPAVKGNVFFTTNERKQMSTKTIFKRVALVVVSALGLSMLSVAPGSAVYNGSPTGTSVTVSAVGRTGVGVHILAATAGTAAADGNACTNACYLHLKLTDAPSGAGAIDVSSAFRAGLALGDDSVTVTQFNGGADATYAYVTLLSGARDTYAAGTYTFQWWVDTVSTNNRNITDGPNSDGFTRSTTGVKAGSITVTLAGTPTQFALTSTSASMDSTSVTSTLVSAQIRDAAGNPTILTSNETYSIFSGDAAAGFTRVGETLNIAGVSTVDSLTGTTIQPGTRLNGRVNNREVTPLLDSEIRFYVGNSSATARTVSIRGAQNLTGISSGSFTMTMSNPAVITRITPNTSTARQAANNRADTSSATLGVKSSTYGAAKEFDQGDAVASPTAVDLFVSTVTGKTLSFGITTSSSTGGLVVATVASRTGVILPTGITTGSKNYTTDTEFSYLSLAATAPNPGEGYDITFGMSNGNSVSYSVTYKAPTVSGATGEGSVVTNLDGNTMKAAVGSTNTVTFTVKDGFGSVVSGATVRAQHNRTANGAYSDLVSATTDANGNASFTFTDALTLAASGLTTLNRAGTVQYYVSTANATSNINSTRNINYTTAAFITPSAITTSGNEVTDAVGAASGTYNLVDTVISETITVTTETGSVMAGIPYSAALTAGLYERLNYASGLTQLSGFTNSSGQAFIRVACYKSGAQSVTWTVGTLTKTVSFTCQSTSGKLRALSVASTKADAAVDQTAEITVTATDIYGNVVPSASLTVTYTGSNARIVSYNGAQGASATTDAAGKLVIGVYSDKAGTGTLRVTTTGGVLATTTTTTQGVAPIARVDDVSVTVTSTGVSAVQAAAEAATDAAAEAIDAANAATDAANLAAEAADAATVAAEEARDAADAATAAVEELATQVATLMAALKAQITTLANTVAKIAKKVRA
jgi:hypothetical protein